MKSVPRAVAATTAAVAALALLAGCSSGSTDTDAAPAATDSATSLPAAPTLPAGWTYVAGTAPTAAKASAKPELPTSVTDSTGAKVEVTDVSKIISAGDDVSSILGALGLGKNIAAASVSDVSPESKAAPKHFEFSQATGAEGLLAMDGTLFIGDNVARHGAVAAKFRDAGTPAVVVDDQLPLADKIQAIADYVGLHDAGAKLAEQVAGQLKDASSEASGNTKLRVIQVTAFGAGGKPSVAGTGTAGAEIIKDAGAVNVGVEAKLRGFSVELSEEGLLASAPDVIVLTVADLKAFGGADGLWKAFPSLEQTPAGQSGTVLVMPDAQLKYPGPESGAGALALAKALAKIDA